MRVERLTSEGGLRIYDNANRLFVERLGREGETRVSFIGFDFDYEPTGNLVCASLRTAEYLATQKQWLGRATDEFQQFLDFLKTTGREIVLRVDLATQTVTVLKQNSERDWEAYPNLTLTEMEARPLGVTLEIDGWHVGMMAIVARREAGQLVIGAGSGDQQAGAVVFRQPLRVNPQYLEGDLSGEAGRAKVKCFIAGEGLAK
ncbi:MAG: hypothetical protein WAV56_01220 [Microgenomates group bacterium]